MTNISIAGSPAAWMLTLLFLGSLFAGVRAEKPEGGASARATDLEPQNNNPASAVQLTDDEVIYGSLRTTVDIDFQDYYLTSVPYGKVLNASLWTLDRDPAIPWRVNFQLIFWYNNGGTLASAMSSYTENPWDNLIFLQIYSQAAMDIWVEVRVNHTQQGTVTSERGNYTLSATVKDPLAFSGAQVSGYMDKRNGPNGGFYYKLTTPIADNKLAIGRLQCPVNGDFDLYVYNLWPRFEHTNIGPRWLVNASWTNASLGNIEEVRVGGSESTAYYIYVQAFDGAGTYTLSFDLTSNAALDDNNVPAKAVLVRDNFPHAQFADQGADPVDWWKITAKAAREIPEIFFTLTSSASNNLFAVILLDQNFNFKACKYNTQTGGWPDFGTTNPNPIMNSVSIKNTVVGYDGPIYICIQAIAHFYGGPEGAAFIPSRGEYKLTFTLPNAAPVFNGPLPEQRMLEDGSLETLVLANYFSDTDGDALSYAVTGSSYSTRPTVDNQTGLVKFTPIANWSGTETVRFRVTDDGPGNKAVEANVTVMVDPVNDAPFLVSSIPDVFIKEGEIGYTPDITTIFRDIDNQVTDLKFNLKVVASNTHPPASLLPTQYDAYSHSYKLGPCNQFFGTYDVQVTCSDGVTGTTPVPTTFKVNVAHINHRPTLRENILDPMELIITEGKKDDHLALADLFVDPDTPEDYANDALTYTVTGEQRLLVDITDDDYLVIDTGKEQYIPGVHYEEKLVITAKDRAGLKTTLNLTVLVDPVNDPPRIVWALPNSANISLTEGQKRAFNITAEDDDNFLQLSYSWYVNGNKDKNARSYVFWFEPDFNAGGNVSIIRVEVSDTTTTVSKEWYVTVIDFNRPPTGVIKAPENMTKYKKGNMVTFMAEGTDPDNDVLTFIWLDDTGLVLGRGPTLTTDELPEGAQTITLRITDGNTFAYQTVTISVYSDPMPVSSGFGFTLSKSTLIIMGLIIVAILVGAIAGFTARRKRAKTPANYSGYAAPLASPPMVPPAMAGPMPVNYYPPPVPAPAWTGQDGAFSQPEGYSPGRALEAPPETNIQVPAESESTEPQSIETMESSAKMLATIPDPEREQPAAPPPATVPPPEGTPSNEPTPPAIPEPVQPPPIAADAPKPEIQSTPAQTDRTPTVIRLVAPPKPGADKASGGDHPPEPRIPDKEDMEILRAIHAFEDEVFVLELGGFDVSKVKAFVESAKDANLACDKEKARQFLGLAERRLRELKTGMTKTA